MVYFLILIRIARRLRKNHEIRSPQVLLIDGEEKVGVISLQQALERAAAKELDLVEVSPLSQPPVCKVMDFGSYLYELKKMEKKQRKASKQTETKTIRMSIRTDKHDLEIKAKQTQKFLEEGHVVKAVVIFKGRELSHKELGEAKLRQLYELVQTVGKIEQQPTRQGYQMMMTLNPIK